MTTWCEGAGSAVFVHEALHIATLPDTLPPADGTELEKRVRHLVRLENEGRAIEAMKEFIEAKLAAGLYMDTEEYCEELEVAGASADTYEGQAKKEVKEAAALVSTATNPIEAAIYAAVLGLARANVFKLQGLYSYITNCMVLHDCL